MIFNWSILRGQKEGSWDLRFIVKDGTLSVYGDSGRGELTVEVGRDEAKGMVQTLRRAAGDLMEKAEQLAAWESGCPDCGRKRDE